MPLIIPLAYFFLLPRPDAFSSLSTGQADDIEDSLQPYSLLATAEDVDEEAPSSLSNPKTGFALSSADKWRLVKPLLFKYMLPLCE
jgi:battenin